MSSFNHHVDIIYMSFCLYSHLLLYVVNIIMFIFPSKTLTITITVLLQIAGKWLNDIVMLCLTFTLREQDNIVSCYHLGFCGEETIVPEKCTKIIGLDLIIF